MLRRLGAVVGLAIVLTAVGDAATSRSARAAAAPVPLTGYLAAPVEQLALPGAQASGEITPQGDVYTGWAEYEPAIGMGLRSWSQPTRVLDTPTVPLFRSALTAQGVLYTERVFTVPVSGQPVTYLSLTATDERHASLRARVALRVAYSRGPTRVGFHGVVTGDYRYERPLAGTGDGFFFQLGVPFDAAWSYRAQGRDVDRDGLLLMRGPQTPAVTTAAAATPDAIGAQQIEARRLAGGQSATWTWQIPLAPPAASATADEALDAVGLTSARRRLAAYWAAQERGMTRIEVPESRVSDVYEASALAILQARYLTASGWVQAVNRLQYQSYWIRDSAIETVALDQIGLHAPAAQNLAFLGHWQQPDGLFISRPGQQDGVGQALWELDQHARLTHDAAFASRQLASVAAAVNWIAQASALDPLGLLPPSTIDDDEQLAGAHITGDDIWAAVGLRSAIDLARFAGRPDLVAAWGPIDTRFEASLRVALAAADARAGHVPPALDQAGGFDWGNDNLGYPLAIVDPRGREVAATVAWEQAHAREGLATYDGMLHDYLGFPIDETELESGDTAAALRGFYAELIHTTAPGFGWEDGLRPFGDRRDPLNLSPHGTFAGQFISLLRNLLVREDGDAIDLLSGVSPAWMAPGDVISVRGAPSAAGTVSLRLTVTAAGDGATLRWSVPNASEPLYWQLPYWVALARGPGGRALRGRVALPGSRGVLTLHWSARRPSLSAALSIAALNRGYRAHGRPAPIVPAPGWS